MSRRHVIASPKRFAPLAASAAIALIGGVVVGARHEPPEKRTVVAFAQDLHLAELNGLVPAVPADELVRVRRVAARVTT